MIGYIYITTNLINNKRYIGKHKNTKFNPNYKGSGIALNKAIDIYGFDNFKVDILEWCKTEADLNKKEIYWIAYYDAVNSREFYNVAEGGNGGNTYAGKTESEMLEIGAKISRGLSGCKNGNKGQYVGEKNSMYGKHHTEETKERIRQKLLGRPKPEGHGEKVSKTLKGKAKSEEHRRNLSIANKGKMPPNAEKIVVVNIETGEQFNFDSLAQMKRELGCNTKIIKSGKISKGYKKID